MEVRLLLAFVLMGLVLLVSQYFIKPAPAPIATKAGAAKNAQPVTPAAVEKTHRRHSLDRQAEGRRDPGRRGKRQKKRSSP